MTSFKGNSFHERGHNGQVLDGRGLVNLQGNIFELGTIISVVDFSSCPFQWTQFWICHRWDVIQIPLVGKCILPLKAGHHRPDVVAEQPARVPPGIKTLQGIVRGGQVGKNIFEAAPQFRLEDGASPHIRTARSSPNVSSDDVLEVV